MNKTRWMFWHLRQSLQKSLPTLPHTLGKWRRFWRQFDQYQQLAPNPAEVQVSYVAPYLNDATAETDVDPIYFHQDAWAFEKIYKAAPARHVDVGSHNKFVALLSLVVDVTMVDIRPLPVSLKSLKFQAGSIVDLPFEDASTPSLSSICVIEHIGLGRYGDPIDPRGSEKAIEELKRVIAPTGDLYISVPIGEKNLVRFNKERVFDEAYLLSLFAPFTLIEARYIEGMQIKETRTAQRSVGCYHLRKP